MSFGNFKDVQEVAVPYQVSVRVANFIRPIPFPVDEAFQQSLQFLMENVLVKMSEAAVCEFLIAPVLQRVWAAYSESLTMWSHVPLGIREPLIGIPDWYFCRRTKLGLVREKPFVIVIEAKKDDFEAGWAQCLAAMLAAQEVNEDRGITVHGCVSNGILWNFGRLHDREFTQDLTGYTISNLPELFAAVNFVFHEARQLVLAPAA